MLSKHQHSLSMRETFFIMSCLYQKYTNFSLESWHMSVNLGRCLSPTWTEGKLPLQPSLWAKIQITMTRKNTKPGSFTIGTLLWVNVSPVLNDIWKAPRVHLIPCHDKGRTTHGPIYHKYIFVINVSYLPWSVAHSRRSSSRCLLGIFSIGTPLWVNVYPMFSTY